MSNEINLDEVLEQDALVFVIGGQRVTFSDVTEDQLEQARQLAEEGVEKNSWTLRQQVALLLGIEAAQLTGNGGRPLGVRALSRIFDEISAHLRKSAGAAGKNLAPPSA